MNIFVTDVDPVKAAMNLDDKRLKHMPKETIEMLACYIHSITGKWLIEFPLWGEVERLTEESKLSLYNHPCTKWVGKDKANAYWLYRHLSAMYIELEYRFGKTLIKEWMELYAKFLMEIQGYLSPIERVPTSFRNSSLYKDKDIITAYRETMIHKWLVTDKKKPIVWTKRGAPKWAEQQVNLSL